MTITSAPTSAWLDADPNVFRADFDREPIVFRHRLGDHPLFAPERLLQLAKRLARNPDDVYYDAGDVRVEQRWDEVGTIDNLPVDAILERIENANAWIILRTAEKDPEYADLLDGCIAEISELAGRDFGKVMKVQHAIIFVNSPNRVTSYHIDRECNCLLQVRGTKTVSVFDRTDREVLPEEEIERFWTVDNNAARFKPQYSDRSTLFELRPGDALHIPVNAPHWVQNGPEVAVSISINFHYRDACLADIYRMNYWLRRAGLRPTPPGVSPLRDGVKRSLWAGARFAKTTSQRLRGMRV
jgi:hypothetical protein